MSELDYELPAELTDRLYIVWLAVDKVPTAKTHPVLFSRLQDTFTDYQFVSDRLLLCKHETPEGTTPPIDWPSLLHGAIDPLVQWQAVLSAAWQYHLDEQTTLKIDAFAERSGGTGEDYLESTDL